MKITAFLLLVFCIHVSASSLAQTKVSLEMKSTFGEVIEKLETVTEYRFVIKSNEPILDKKVEVTFVNEGMNKVLDELLEGSGYNYKIIDRYIAISPIEENASQQKSVSGKVTDENGEPLPGVTVIIKGTTQGTVTSFDGSYSITDVPENVTLQFSFVGMKTQDIEVGNQLNINVIMAVDAIGLEEVIAVGYGTMKKSDLTGSVTKVNVEELAELPNVSVIQAMQGTVAGLNVGAVDQAGENPVISIRGQNSLSSNSDANSPLIVVDGTIYRGSLVDLNTADIESVDILKDASSAAIYGSQASNGVMLITTKRGTRISKPIISYSGSYTLQAPSNKLEPMNGAELTEFYPNTFWDSGSRLAPDYLEKDPSFDVGQYLKTNEITEGFRNGMDNNWWDLFTGNGYINNQNLSIRGKTENLGYFVSGGITDVKGFVKNDDYTKYNYRINLDSKINDWMSVGIESFLTASDYSGVSPNISNLFYTQPWAPIYDQDNEYILLADGLTLNPFLTIQQDDSDKRLNIFGNIHADIKLPIKGLEYKINFSQNYRTTNQDRFNPWGASYTGSGYKNTYMNYDWAVDNIVTYKRTFNKVHHVNATFVYGVEKRDYSFTKAGAENFTNDLLGYHKLEAGDPTLRTVDTGKEEEQSLYSMARLMYNFNNRYLITGTVRRDGFSGFGTDDKIGVFPSVALGWVASDENFIKENLSWLNYLKIRGSYGQTGKRGLGRYDTRAIISTHPSIVYGDGGSAIQGQWISSMANNKLGWETTTGINLGADFALLNSRIHGNVEYYNNDTENILYPIQLPTMTGFSSINTNIGKVANHGLEFTLAYQVINNQDLKWEASVNFSRNRNEIVSILGYDNDNDGIEDDLVANRLFIGEPQQVIYDYEIIGMWQLADEDAGIIPDGFYPGTYKINDISGPDGIPDDEFSATYDKKILGYQDPSYRLGITNTVNYKQFSLYVFINSIQGGKDYYYATDHPFVYKKDQLTYQNVPKGTWDYWMPENPNAYFRRLDTPSQYAPNRYAQRNFIRLQDVSLSYQFDKSLVQKFDIESLKVFVSGKNLATITKWRGWDPETGTGFTPGRPLMANYTIGVNVEF